MSGILRFFKIGESRHEIFATWVAIGILFLYWCVGFLASALKAVLGRKKRRVSEVRTAASESIVTPVTRLNKLVTETDLQKLIRELDEVDSSSSWRFVVDKSNKDVSYFAQRREPEDGGPTEYLSTTTFQNCTAELLRDFYMDSEFRLQWDKTVVKHLQLDLCHESGTEVGRTVKKFPFMMAREYVLAWRLWAGTDNTFYCVIKACDHPAAPRLQQFKRVEDYLSGWRIQTVPGTNACEVKMLHREDLGMGREMAKMAFSRGIWSFVTKMENNLRSYISMRKKRRASSSSAPPDAVSLCSKMNLELEPKQAHDQRLGGVSSSPGCSRRKSSSGNPSSHASESDCNRPISLLTQSMFLLGWAVLLGHGSTSLGAKIAAAVFMNKAVRKRSAQQLANRYVPKSFSIHR